MNALRGLFRPGPVALLGLLLAAALWAVGLATTPLTVPFETLYQIEPIGEIRGLQSAGETIVAPYNGLYRIDVKLADYGHPRTGLVSFRLETDPERTLVVERVFHAEEIQGDVTYQFEFPPVPDSATKHFYFELVAPTAVVGNAITAYVQPSGGYPDGQAYFAGRPVPGNLVFAMYFQVNGWERARVLLSQAAVAKPGQWGQAGFYVLLGAAYMALVAGLFWSIQHETDHSNPVL